MFLPFDIPRISERTAMPIVVPRNLRRLDQDEFRKLDYAVMRHVYDCQNELGRLCDEEAYQRDLAARIENAGLGTTRLEEPIEVIHESFLKRYEIDLIIADGLFYETKAVSVLAGEHQRQLLTYLMLCDQPRGKLVNFRPTRVEDEFVNSPLRMTDRLQFQIQAERWTALSDRCDWLRDLLNRLLGGWGAFLEVKLYVDAIAHFLGGESVVHRHIPLSRNGVHLGLQQFHLLTPDIAFRVTALTREQEKYESHLRRLLELTDLRAVQWINLRHHDIELVTITREMAGR